MKIVTVVFLLMAFSFGLIVALFQNQSSLLKQVNQLASNDISMQNQMIDLLDIVREVCK